MIGQEITDEDKQRLEALVESRRKMGTFDASERKTLAEVDPAEVYVSKARHVSDRIFHLSDSCSHAGKNVGRRDPNVLQDDWELCSFCDDRRDNGN